jgi:LexA DNA binding domain-containing protein
MTGYTVIVTRKGAEVARQPFGDRDAAHAAFASALELHPDCEVKLMLDGAVVISAAPKAGLTAPQRDVLLIIQELTALDGVSPSYSELSREMVANNRGNAHRAVECLIERGYLACIPNRARSLTVLRPIPMPEEPEIELTPAGERACGGRP